MRKSILRRYAELIARCGVNIEKGQYVIINAGLEQPEFIEMLTEECYKAGASEVIVQWFHQPLEKLDTCYKTLKKLSEVKKWQKEKKKWESEVIPCTIHIISDDPEGMIGIDSNKLAKAKLARHKILKPYIDAMEGKDQWCIAAVPGKAWAKKVFPGMRTSQAVEKLWEAILSTSRVTDDPVQAWKDHNADLERRCAYLNSLGAAELRYHASNGTDFRVGMIPQAVFVGAGETSLLGHYFNPNIPSEEIFISPMKGKAEGIVYSSMPLCYEGQLIENFSIRFENGKAVEAHAEKNEDLLNEIISMDEGSCYLGECALVPYDSPIRNSGILFYETLFDENAACHLALGMGFIDTIRDYGRYTLEECWDMGINDSMMHVDFMIGTEDMDIDAVLTDGTSVPIFRNGNWAF